ncbi:Ig-like domain-containing protein [Cellulomonas sp. ICMP 17802]|uniref:Ig-like domain-containing protein n=1 Tax=Cellulomonas sp. ICMP 17802 TaxID=3239199 RepID=UPI00351AF2FE
MVTVPALVLVLALLNQGFPLARLDLNDGAVWLTATSQSQLGRFNAQVEELNGGIVAQGKSFDVLQDAGDVLLVEPGNVAVVDPANVATTTQVAAPGTIPSMAAGTVALYDGDGNVWVRAIGDLDSLRTATDTPEVETGEGGRAVVARSGVAFAVAATDGTVTRVDLSTGSPQTTAQGSVGAGTVDQITAVGDEPVTLSGSTVRTLHGSVELAGEDLTLQQPGPASSRVLVSSRDALFEVPLDGGRAVEHRTTGSGTPAQPVQVGACAHAAWASPIGSYLQLCDGGKADVRDLEDMSSADVLTFRVNRQMVVLNDTLRGRLWLPLEDTRLRVPNWTDVVPQEQPQEADDQTQTSDTTQDLVTECSTESASPTAQDDDFGVRPGRTTILPVIDNDSSSDCGILAISQFEQLPEQFGRVEAIYGGRALQVSIAAGATGTASFTYTITDGRGTSAPPTAHVRLTVRQPGEDEPPRQLRTGSMRVEQGGQADHQVLADFIDPDGDDLLLVGATADPAAGSVRFRQDGTLTFKADGASLGRTQVTVEVSDGTTTTEGTIDVDVRPGGSLAPQIDPVFAVTYVGQAVTLHPLTAVRSSSAEPPRLAGVDDVVGATITSDLQGGTFTFSAARAGTYYVPFLIAAAPQQATGLARVDVLEWPDAPAPPVAVRDKAFLPPGGEVTIDPLENDSDAEGKVLVLQSVEVPDGAGLKVAVIDHHLVQIRAERTLEGPVALRYTVSNGQASAVGEIVVQPVPASATSQPPVVENVEVSVRTGGVVTIPVLDTAYDPDGDHLTLVRQLAEPLGDGEGLLFVSGDVLRYQAPDSAVTAHATFAVQDATGNVTAATVTVRVHASDASTKAPPRPKNLVARVYEGDKVRIDIPLVGIDPDGDGVTLLGQASAAAHGRVTEVGPDWIEYQALPGELGTDTFTYAVEDWVGQRAVAEIRVGIGPRPTGAASVVARDDEVTVRPGQRVEVRVLANDIDSSGGELTLDPVLDKPDGTDATVDGRRIVVHAPDQPGVLQIAYTVSNDRGGHDTGVLTVTVAKDAPVLAPIARDVVVPALDTIGRTEVSVDVLGVAQNPSGPLSDLAVSVPGALADVARVDPAGKVVVTLVDHAQTLPYELSNTTSPDGSATAYAFITVPALGFFRPVPRPKAPELRVASGEQLVIPLSEQVQVAPGREASIADPLGVSATKSDGTDPVKDTTTLQFRSAPGYAGPASITVPVTDASGPGDTSARTSVITLQITVFAVDDHPPTFTPSVIDVAPGEEPLAVDLRSFTVGPEGATPAEDRYSYQLTAAVPAGFTGGIEDGILRVAADETTPKGRTDQLQLRIGYGRTGSLAATIDLRVIASTRRTAVVNDRVITDGVEGQQTTVNVLDDAYNPFPDSPLTVVGATVETPGAGTASATDGTVSVRPALGFIGQMVTRYRVRDVTGDPDREVEGRITVTVRGKPATPTAPRIGEVRDRTVVLSWDAPDNRGAPITGYRVVADPGTIVRQCASTTCTIDNLTNDTEYTFTVAAQNAVDWSEASLPSASARPDAVPNQPAPPVLTSGDGSVRATWEAPVSSGSPVSSYTLEISPAPPTGPASVSSTTTSYTFSGLKNGTAYTVRVRAQNRAPEPSAWSDSSQPEVPAGVPAAPTDLVAQRVDTPLGGQINVSWTEPNGNGDRVAGYELVISNGPNARTVVLDGSATAYAFTDAANGPAYRFQLRARNKAPGWSAPAIVNASTYGLPSAPTSVSADADPGQGRIVVRWSGADGNGTSIRAYVVRMPDGSERDVGGATSFTDTGLRGGSSYAYQVRAVNDAGSSGWSPSASAVATTAPDAPPVSLAVTANGTGGRPTEITITRGDVGNDGGGQNLQYTWELRSDRHGPVSGTFSGTTAVVDVSGWDWRFQGTQATATVTASTTVGSTSNAASINAVWGQPPSVVRNLAVVSDDPTTPTRITVSWDAPAQDGGIGIDRYDVCWTVNGQDAGCQDTGGTSVQRRLSDFLAVPVPGDTVTATVSARNGRGSGPTASVDFVYPAPATP